MFRKENPWSEWLGNGLFAHPNAPCRGGGPVGRRIGAPSVHRGAVSPWSPAGRYVSPREAAAGYALYELECVLDGLRDSTDALDLHRVSLDAFGLGSYSGRFGDALRHTGIAGKLLPLLKTIVAAELHDYLGGGRSWSRGENWTTSFPPKLCKVGQYLHTLDVGSRCDLDGLERMATTRAALLKELGDFLNQATPVFIEARAKLDPRTAEYWQQHNDLAKTRLSHGDAGWYLGEVCASVLPSIAESMRRGDFYARIAGAAPLLAKYALEVKEAAGAAGAPVVDNGSTSAPTVDPRARVPFHNEDTLTPDVEKGSFKTERPVDMNNLSPEEDAVVNAMELQGRTDETIQRQLLSSADSFEVVEAKKGDSVYGFTSSGRPKGQNSMYWMSEEDYNALQAKHCKDGVWNREAVKNELALPCYNRANSVVKSEVLDDHTAIRSHIGPATERVSYTNDPFSSGMYTKPMPGGGYQYTPSASKIAAETIVS